MRMPGFSANAVLPSRPTIIVADKAGSGSGSRSFTLEVTNLHLCYCVGACRLTKWCLLDYCYEETVCDDCAAMYCEAD